MTQKKNENRGAIQPLTTSPTKEKGGHATVPTQEGYLTRSFRNRIGANGEIEPQIKYLDHAPVHPVYCHADGLFRPLPKDKQKHPLDISKNYTMRGKRFHGRWVAPIGLNIVDQCVLFFLCKLAAQPGQFFEVSHSLDANGPEIKSLEESGDILRTTLRYVSTTLPAIARGIGFTPTGTNYMAVMESLSRLAGVRLTRTLLDANEEPTEIVGATKMIGLICSDSCQCIVLSKELSDGCERNGSVAWVNLREQKGLGKAAKRLHAWLSYCADSKRVQKTKLHNLPIHIWGPEPCSRSALKTRMQQLPKLIAEIQQLPGWVCRVVVETDPGTLLAVKNVVFRKPVFAGVKPEIAVSATPDAGTTSAVA